MGFRSVVISSKVNLSIKENNLVITKNNEPIKIPLEDIGAIVLECNQILITAYTLSILADNNIAVFTCNEVHIPNGVLMSYLHHSRQSKIARLQIGMSEPFKKRIWQKIIKQKVYNQAECLRLLELYGCKYLYNLSKQVKSGDSDFIEARAAQYYFKNLYDCSRREDSIINGALNYGYAILRGAIARSLSAHGFYPPIGIHHRSELNEFNLADDFIEPFRPYIDIHVALRKYENELTKDNRNALVAVLHNDCLLDEKKYSVMYAIDLMISSFVTCINKNNYKLLKLPTTLIPKEHEYE